MPVNAFIFPGQGSQSVGMGQDLAAAFGAARDVFDEGPTEELTLTENAQPALMAVSLAVMRVLEREGGLVLPQKAALVAGHSLGEYSALAAAGSLQLAETARLLRLRGTAMQRAVPAGEGAMAALLGTELEQAAEICREAATDPETGAHQVVQPANDNGGGQVVISGHKAAVERAIEISRARGIKRAMLLPVSAPFHCALMAPAADAMAEALATAAITAPLVPVVANVSAAKATDPAAIRTLLVEQVTGLVRWRESVQAMVSMGVDTFIEIGAGRVLAGLVRRIAPEATTRSIGTPAEIEDFLKG
jgi:[acyl-carrier-protein] S-malonyltransferase